MVYIINLGYKISMVKKEACGGGSACLIFIKRIRGLVKNTIKH